MINMGKQFHVAPSTILSDEDMTSPSVRPQKSFLSIISSAKKQATVEAIYSNKFAFQPGILGK